MGPNGSKNLKTLYLLQITAKGFKTFFRNFLLNDPHITTFGIFEILKIYILTNFNIFVVVNMGPYASENFKMLLLQIAAKIFYSS